MAGLFGGVVYGGSRTTLGKVEDLTEAVDEIQSRLEDSINHLIVIGSYPLDEADRLVIYLVQEEDDIEIDLYHAPENGHTVILRTWGSKSPYEYPFKIKGNGHKIEDKEELVIDRSVNELVLVYVDIGIGIPKWIVGNYDYDDPWLKIGGSDEYPEDCPEGWSYYDTDSNKNYWWNGSKWK